MLKKLRLTISIIVFGLLTFYFLDFAGILSVKIHVFGHIQFIPALISRSIVIVVCLVVCVLLFGRIYCSSLCPMGIFQDIVNRCSKSICSKKKFTYRKNNLVLRWSIVVVSLILFFFGFTIVIGILDPYSAYGRMVVHIFSPIYMFINNILASIFNNFGNHTFYKVKIEVFSIFSLGVAIFTFIIVSILAWTKGRFYCNTICPVGTILGFLNKFSLFKIKINNEQCVSCGICADKCKASCIDLKTKSVDYNQCVNCFNCINNCNRKGISFIINKNKSESQSNQPKIAEIVKIDKSKRNFLLMGLGVVTIPKVLTSHIALGSGTSLHRTIPISPPGSVSTERLLSRCTSCHLCISKCFSKVLKPAFMEYGIGGMMMPVMHFEKGFCNYNCTICTRVCPTHALLPLTREQKHRLQVGKVVFIPEICVVHTDKTSCGACSEHCPTQAVKMVPYKDGLTIPFIDVDICVGCGGCEYICPVRPYRAIFVEGNKIHEKAKAFTIEKSKEKEITDFGF